MANNVLTGKVRASFVHIFAPTSINGSDPKYSCAFIIPKTDVETLNKIRAAIDQAKEDGRSKWGGKIPANLKLPLRDGDVDRPDDEAYANSFFVNASNKEAPAVVDRDRVKITDPQRIYSGCYVRACLNFYPFSVNVNKGVACSLSGVQFWSDGEPLNGRICAEKLFDAIEDDEDFLD